MDNTARALSADGCTLMPKSQASSPTSHESSVDWHMLVKRIEAATRDVQRCCTRGLKYFLTRKLGTDCEDAANQTLLIVLHAIRKGIFQSLNGSAFVRTVAMREGV
jgi:hypothetical protein